MREVGLGICVSMLSTLIANNLFLHCSTKAGYGGHKLTQ